MAELHLAETPRGRATGPEDGAIFRAPGWAWASAGEVGWWVRPDWREPLIGPDGLRLEEWARQGRLTTIKTGPLRTVYRADLPEGSVYIKHFRVPGLRAKIRQWVRRGKGRNEGRRAARVAELGVPTITPIALGEQRRHRFLLENYLVTRAIPDMIPLDEFVERRVPAWPEPRQSRARRYLAEALAVLTARLHEAGFVHGDFHPGNILVRMDEDDRPRLAMIDLDALRVRRHLSWAAVRDNLALLNHFFWLRCRRVDRYRFLHAYFEARGIAPHDPRGFAVAIEKATRSWAERLWRRWGRRCRASNKYFKKYRTSDAWAIASRALDPATVRALMADPDAPFDQPATRILKMSRTTTVAELTLPVGREPTPVIYKRFNRRQWIDPLLALFRPSRAWRAWQAGQDLTSRGLPTPKNLALIGRPWLRLGRRLAGVLPREMVVVTLRAEPSITLGDYARQVLPGLPPEVARKRRIALTLALARLIRTLHERSLSHRDLKASNILIDGDLEDGAEVRLSLIDLVGVNIVHPMSRDRRLQNLARLQVSLAEAPGRTRTDALRFLRAYLPWSLWPREEWKRLWREVDARCDRKRARNRRRGRILS